MLSVVSKRTRAHAQQWLTSVSRAGHLCYIWTTLPYLAPQECDSPHELKIAKTYIG